jgi:hypothetical protein
MFGFELRLFASLPDRCKLKLIDAFVSTPISWILKSPNEAHNGKDTTFFQTHHSFTLLPFFKIGSNLSSSLLLTFVWMYSTSEGWEPLLTFRTNQQSLKTSELPSEMHEFRSMTNVAICSRDIPGADFDILCEIQPGDSGFVSM